MSDFIHLHNHSDYSLLDAAQTVERMCNRVYDLGIDSIALTEHGNLFYSMKILDMNNFFFK